MKRGEGHPRAKLSDTEVRLVRALHQQSELGYKSIARKFEVSPSCVRNIVSVVTEPWAWVIERLERWADWARLSIAAGRGYPCEAAFIPRAKGRAIESCSTEVEQTEQAVAALPPELRVVILAKYVHEGSLGDKAKRLHMHRATPGAHRSRASHQGPLPHPAPELSAAPSGSSGAPIERS